MRPLELDLDVYQGPFDLLLSLVFKEEIDLLEVPLFEVISAYLDEMEATGATADWDEMSEFLLLMSLLVEIKSRLLLPGSESGLETELTPEQARNELLGRLFEYSKFKAAACRLRELGEAERRLPAPGARARTDPPATAPRRHRRQRGRDAAARSHDAGAREPARTGHDSYHPDEGRASAPDPHHPGRSSRRRGKFSFNGVFGGEPPLVQALSLFALLDLLARGEIRVSQTGNFADIKVRLRDMPKAV